MDLVIEIHPASSKQHRYILMGIDYFTKWITEIHVVNVDQEVVIDFILKHIIYRFGALVTITTD